MKKPGSIDEYLKNLSADKRESLQKLRKIIKAAAPKAQECISYGIPAYRLNGLLVGFGAAANHCSFYPMSSSTLKHFEKELRKFKTSKGTIRFQPETPPPASLIRKIIKARIIENSP